MVDHPHSSLCIAHAEDEHVEDGGDVDRVAKTCLPCQLANFSQLVLIFGQSMQKTMPLCPCPLYQSAKL